MRSLDEKRFGCCQGMLNIPMESTNGYLSNIVLADGGILSIVNNDHTGGYKVMHYGWNDAEYPMTIQHADTQDEVLRILEGLGCMRSH